MQRLFILPFVFLMSCWVVTIGWFLYQAGDNATEVLARNALVDTISHISHATDRYLLDARETLRVVAPDPIPPLDKNDPPVLLPFPQDKAALEERLWLASSLFDDPSYVYFASVDGSFLGLRQEEVNLFMYSERDGPQGKNYVYHLRGPGTTPVLVATQDDYEPRQRPWYLRAVARQQETWSPVYADYRLKFLGLSLSKPVYGSNRQLLGVATSSVQLSRLSGFLQALPMTGSGVAFIAEMSGDLIATSVNELIYKVDDKGANLIRLNAAQSSSPVVRQAYVELLNYRKMKTLAPGEQVTQSFSGEGTPIAVAFRRYVDDAGLDWVAVSAVNRSDFLGSVTGSVYQTLLLGLMAVCLTFVLGFMILRWVLRDIRKLTLAAKRIGNGEPFPSLNIDRRDEIGQLAQSFQEMEHNLRTDRLTNVLNRDSFIAQIDFRRRNDTESTPLHFAILFIDLDKFKTINDEHGHDEGDKVLISAAAQLQHALRKDDAVARFGGDEFVIYLHGITEMAIANSIGEKIRHFMKQPTEGRDGKRYEVDASIGAALYPQDGLDVETLLRKADERMFEQKRLHRVLSG